jgi:hypothetical protein
VNVQYYYAGSTEVVGAGCKWQGPLCNLQCSKHETFAVPAQGNTLLALIHRNFSLTCTGKMEGYINCPKIEEPPQNSRHLKSDMKQIPY